MKRAIYLIVILYTLCVRSDLPKQLYVSELNTHDTLLQNTVYTIHRSNKGLVYFATQGGISSYDGYSLRGYQRHSTANLGLFRTEIWDMSDFGQDALFVATEETIASFNKRDHSFRNHWQITPKHVKQGSSINNLVFDSSTSQLWVGTDYGLHQFDTLYDKERRLVLLEGKNVSLAKNLFQNKIVTLVDYREVIVFNFSGEGVEKIRLPEHLDFSLISVFDDVIYLAGKSGLYRLSSDFELEVMWKPEKQDVTTVTMMTKDHEKRIWMVLDNHGIGLFHSESREFQKYDTYNSNLPSNSVKSLYVDSENILWIGTSYNGVRFINLNGPMFEYIKPAPKEKGEYNSIRQLVELSHHNILVGTDHGLAIYNVKSDSSQLIPPEPSGDYPRNKTEINDFNPYISAIVQKNETQYWIGTREGLLVFDINKKSYSMFDSFENTSNNLFVEPITSIHSFENGNLLISTMYRKMYLGKMNNKNGKYELITLDERFNGRNVHALYQTGNNELWMGSNQGLVKVEVLNEFEFIVKTFEKENPVLAKTAIRSMHKSDNGVLWLATHDGLFKVLTKNDAVVEITRDPSNSLLSNTKLYSILSTSNDYLWLSHNRGISRVETKSGRVVNYDDRKQLNQLEFNGAARLIDSMGMFYFGGMTGINRFEPKTAGNYSLNDELMITGIHYGFNLGKKVVYGATPLVFRNNENSVNIKVALSNFKNTANNRFRYSLNTLNAWQDVVSGNDISLIGLPPGDYRLTIQGKAEDGFWQNAPSKIIAFKVEQVLWLRWQALLAYASLFIGLVVMIQWLSYKRKKEQQEMLASIERSEKKLKLALWGSGDGLWSWSLSRNCITRVNVEGIYGNEYSGVDDELNSILPFIHESDRSGVTRFHSEFLEGKREGSIVYRVRNTLGQWMWLEERGRVVNEDEDRNALEVAGIYRDITVLKRAELELKISEKIIHLLHEAVVVTDEAFDIQFVNPSFLKMTGYESNQLQEQALTILDSERDNEKRFALLRETVRRDSRSLSEFWIQCKNAELLCIVEALYLYDPNEHFHKFAFVLIDVTQQRKNEQELIRLARYDNLTGLPNRQYFLERIDNAIIRARRRRFEIALLFIDLDGFKLVNDKMGHLTGDKLLLSISKNLSSSQRKEDCLARLGGDEFVMIIEDFASANVLENICKRIISTIDEVYVIDGNEVKVSASLGVSLYPKDANQSEKLLEFADAAMYRAKKLGKNQYQFYSRT